MPHSTNEHLAQPVLRQRASMDSVKCQPKEITFKGISPPVTRGRVAKLNSFYASRSASNSADRLTLMSESTTTRNAFRALNIRRWDGNRRTTINWDGLRKDTELWFPEGDCLVHFYGPGQSKRGASLRVHYSDIESSNCQLLLQRHDIFSQSSKESPISTDGGISNEPASDGTKHELFLPAPAHLSREEAFKYHLTTRNFFAWLYERPLVGDRLAEALITLLERMNEYRPKSEENLADILVFIDGQEYSDFRECPDHALAALQFAEKFELRDLWTDAFVHCAGMNDDLSSSGEFDFTSRTSKALITRAHLEMDLRLEHAGRALGNFLEDELSGTYLGLGQDARVHLERFRSFLHSFYVQKYGYWPPPQPKRNSKTLPKSTYQAMYSEVRNLYEYLVDADSSDSFENNRQADGGICVLQNIKALDNRHKYTSLPHVLPLLPVLPQELAGPKAHGIAKIFSSKQARVDRRQASSAALFRATNAGDMTVLDCNLVRQYIKFEKSWSMREEERITCADARKVRWILIYAMLQTLISVTRAPKEVKDTEGVSYPLCCQIAGTPPWNYTSRTQLPGTILQKSHDKQSEAVNEIKPDNDWSALKPHPLTPRAKAVTAGTLPHKISISHALSVKSPQPQKAGLCEMLLHEYELNPSPDRQPSPPSSSEEEGSSGWDSSSNEDIMEHQSVTGSASFYGDGDDLGKPFDQMIGQAMGRKSSIGSFQQSSFNPEVERYIES